MKNTPARGIKAFLMISVLALVLVPVTVTAEATTVTTNNIVPFNRDVFVSCANGGAGEVIALNGNLHVLTSVTGDGNGGARIMTHFQPQGITGTGQTTGDKYQATGVTLRLSHIVLTDGPATMTFVSNFRILGPGKGNNHLVHRLTHVTVNGNGETTVDLGETSIECK